MIERASGVRGAGASGGGQGLRRLSSGVGAVEVSSSAGRIAGGAVGGASESNGGSSGAKPGSGRYTRLARYGPGLGASTNGLGPSGQAHGSASSQYRAPHARAYNMRSGAAQHGAHGGSGGGFGGLGGGGKGSNLLGGGGLGAGSAGTSLLTSQRTGLGGMPGAKPPYGVVPAGNGGIVQAYGGRRGSNSTVGVGGSGVAGFGGVGVGFGRHKYG